MTVESINVEENKSQVTKASKLGLLSIFLIAISVTSALVMVVSERFHDVANSITTLFTYLALFAKCAETKALYRVLNGLGVRAE